MVSRSGPRSDLPDPTTTLLPRRHKQANNTLTPQLRCSPRKNPRPILTEIDGDDDDDTAYRQPSEPRIPATTKSTQPQQRHRCHLQTTHPSPPNVLVQEAKATQSLLSFDEIPILSRRAAGPALMTLPRPGQGLLGAAAEEEEEQEENSATAESRSRPQRTGRNDKVCRASRLVLSEAACDQDLVDEDAQDEGDSDEDTDLSGFIVDDDAELSYYGSEGEGEEEVDSEEERRARRRRKAEKVEKVKVRPRRRLQRGRKKQVDDSEEEEKDEEDVLADVLGGLRLDGGAANTSSLSSGNNGEIEVIDLISPSPERRRTSSLKGDDDGDSQGDTSTVDLTTSVGANLFEKFQALKLSPPRGSSRSIEIPSKPLRRDPMPSSFTESEGRDEVKDQDQFTTPPATPPRSPNKLRSPSKQLKMSPSKPGDGVQQQSPHRQSTDAAFWDLDKVNTWNDEFSPRKAPVASPRKNRLAAVFDLWPDVEEERKPANDDNDDDEDKSSFEAIPETSSSPNLPSPCSSPTKSQPQSQPIKTKSRPAATSSPVKLELQRLREEKKSQAAAKAHFDAAKDDMARDLLAALDEHVTHGQLARLARSTGGVQIAWSKTLRSTAGRANWRRTVTRPAGGAGAQRDANTKGGVAVVVQHYASIELAVKIVDRPERLVSTLAHEFCHLANFMVSGVRERPHGVEFQGWARRVTGWMRGQEGRPEWRGVEVTTKHGYVIEWKYLWVCMGREGLEDQRKKNGSGVGGFVARLLSEGGDLEGETGGCGAEYGRHSKSVDPEQHRCGRCQGLLLKVRQKPRMAASPAKKSAAATAASVVSPRKKNGKGKGTGGAAAIEKNTGVSDRIVEIVELSD